MHAPRVSEKIELPYDYLTCPSCSRVNTTSAGAVRFRCIKCGSDLRMEGDLLVVERVRSRQRARWIAAAAMGVAGLALALYGSIQDFLVDLPTLRRLDIPAWEWWLPIRKVYLHLLSPLRAMVPGLLGMALLASAALLARRARRLA